MGHSSPALPEFFPLDTIVALRYKKSTNRMPVTLAWRGDGATDGTQAHGLAVSLCTAGLGAHSHSGPSLCAHAPRRTDTAPRAGGSVGGSPQGELHALPSAAVVGLALQEASPAYDGYHTPQSGGKTGPCWTPPGAVATDSGARSPA